MTVLNLIHVRYFTTITKTKLIKMYGNLVFGNEKCLQTTAGSLTTQLEESRSGVADDLPVSTSCHMPCSSTASSSTQATSMASQPSRSCEVLLSAKECKDLIAQFFGTNSSTQLLHFQTVQLLKA